MTGGELAGLRKRLGLTQVAFAERLGVHANTLARYERDELSIPEPVARLARILAGTDRPPRKRRS
jgi:transcriptional regulator with XRE-family HTH domain